MPSGVVVRAGDLVLTSPVDSLMSDVRTKARQHGFDIDSAGDESLRDELEKDALLRNEVLEVWARTGDGRLFHAGCPVVKNVAGLDIGRLVCGTAGRLAVPEAVTLRLRPRGRSSRRTSGSESHVSAPEPTLPMKALRQVFDPDARLVEGGGE